MQLLQQCLDGMHRAKLEHNIKFYALKRFCHLQYICIAANSLEMQANYAFCDVLTIVQTAGVKLCFPGHVAELACNLKKKGSLIFIPRDLFFYGGSSKYQIKYVNSRHLNA